ncbi:peptidylprolyl isomerase [Aureliella helgolandensis]|uniref:Peptidyl-prolyl cis-trans isomerase n=1 Tax=Aureliella helgolandensis TaxID=2527968 RepID=A0A518G436_9BACT|nr:peptidylprolyl isomerase [Aureliella helgolandensis]QDV23309.1 Peptidyl-prolyl cis-trans isomerase cyp18 [Aureliella helgolandensis]
MRTILNVFSFSICLTMMTLSAGQSLAKDNPIVVIKTNHGDMKVELFADEAPLSTANFLKYAEAGYYDGTIFHRVIPDFMIQGGGFEKGMKKKGTHAPIKNESGNGLKNEKYTLAMARTGDPHSATSQFFINVKDNGFLNRAESQDGVGYAVFGRVIEGMDVVDKIKMVKTQSLSFAVKDVPVEDVIMTKVEVQKEAK